MSKSITELISMEGLTRPPTDLLVPKGSEAAEAPAPWYRFENKAAEDGSASDSTDIFIYDQIGGWFGMTATDFIEELKAVETAKISLHLNSPGGEVFDAVAIYNSLVNHSAEVTVYVDGLAASAASFIAQCGDKVVMQKASTMMIHDASGMAWGNAKDMAETANILNKISDNIASIYADRAGGTTETWRAFMQEEVWYTAKEAVAAGLADEVSAKATKEAVPKDKFNLAIFNFAYKGRDDAPSPDEVTRKVENMGKRTVVNQSSGSEGAPVVPAVEGEDEEVTPETPPVSTPAEDEPVVPAVETPATGPTAASGRVILNGVAAGVTDMTAIQNHINGLEQFRKETLEAGRHTFVQNLASDNKIGAPQVEGLDAFALGLDATQYEAWTKTWDVAVTLPMLGIHAAGTTNHAGDTSVEFAAADHLSVLKDTVKQHKMSGMPKEQIEKTASYNELTKLDPTFTL